MKIRQFIAFLEEVIPLQISEIECKMKEKERGEHTKKVDSFSKDLLSSVMSLCDLALPLSLIGRNNVVPVDSFSQVK